MRGFVRLSSSNSPTSIAVSVSPLHSFCGDAACIVGIRKGSQREGGNTGRVISFKTSFLGLFP